MDMKTFNQRLPRQKPHISASPSISPAAQHVHSGDKAGEPIEAWRLEPRKEKDALADKLALEIEQLEAWLANQQTTQQGSISVIPTIKSLIHTRKKLLKNIQSTA